MKVGCFGRTDPGRRGQSIRGEYEVAREGIEAELRVRRTIKSVNKVEVDDGAAWPLPESSLSRALSLSSLSIDPWMK
jgi:hypothetical protein